MIALKEAYEKALSEAKKQYKDGEILGCKDIGDRYCFDPGADGQILIGAGSITVDKRTGDIGFITIPPMENLELLKNGTEVDISEFKEGF